MCLAPIWKAYEVLDAGTDVAAVLTRMISKLDLTQVSCPLPILTPALNPLCICLHTFQGSIATSDTHLEPVKESMWLTPTQVEICLQVSVCLYI